MDTHIETKYSIGDKVYLLREEFDDISDSDYEFKITEHTICEVIISIQKNLTTIGYRIDTEDEEDSDDVFDEEPTENDCWIYGSIFETRDEAQKMMNIIKNSLER